MAPRYFVLLVALGLPAALAAQTSASLQGSVSDETGAVLPAATVRVRSQASGIDRSVSTTPDGRYFVVGLPAGRYHVTASATGFRSEVIEDLILEVERTVVRDFRLGVGSRETVVVHAEIPLVERGTATVGHAVTPMTVQEIPLNGRRFVDLGLLVPGSVAPSQTGFSTTPLRGIGALAINTAGNREEAVGFHVNGVSTNNLTYGSLIFLPPISSIQEFRVDNSALPAPHGHVSGAIVSMVTRSGTDDFHGEVFEFFRDDALDARNFFELTPDPHPFRRNQFGGSIGGPVLRGRTFFYGAYEGMRQRQGLDLNSLVLSAEQRASVSNPAVRRLVELIPLPNTIDSGGNPRFVGSAEAVVDTDRWTVDVQQNLGKGGRLHFFYGTQRQYAIEPATLGTTIPGFGNTNRSSGSILTLGETHVLGPALFNEVRFGRSTLDGRLDPRAQLDPLSFGIRNGVERPLGLPQLVVAGGLNFGGPATFPVGRIDASYILADTLQFTRGRQAIKAGGEYRTFLNENFSEGTGSFNFPTVDAFLAGTANAFSITLGERRNHITQRALSGFIHDAIRAGPRFTFELGLRYEWHVTPTERDDQFVVFNAATVSLERVGVDRPDRVYRQNNQNVEPRAGVVWDINGSGLTVLRAAYGWTADEPSTTAVRDTAANPPFATPLTGSGSIAITDALSTTRPVGLAPATVDYGFRNASLQSWNVNVQRQIGANLAASIGYFGSSGRNLRISRNLNQPVNGRRPYPSLSPSSPVEPGTPLGNITQVESSGFSSYHALWVTATNRRSHGLQLDASYSWSKSIDTNSLNSSGFAVQDSYDIPNQYGLSDFDARHRFVVSAIYELPFPDRGFTRGWQIAAIVQGQSGNPVNIVTSASTLNGVPNTVRPDLTGPIRIIGSVDQWFDPSAFTAVDRFGNLGRNVVIGPAFHNTDLSLIKNTPLPGNVHLQLRADVFDLFNHPNFGPPGNIVGSPTFARITRTRLATGEGGSSRQIQLAAKLSF